MVEQIITIGVALVVLFLGYLLFTRYSRAKAKQIRDPRHLVTKVYNEINEFDFEAPKMLEGGYVITYIASGKRYFITEGMSLEQIRKGPLAQLSPDGKIAFLVNYSL